MLASASGRVSKKSVRAAEQGRADVVEARRVWQEAAETIDPEQLVFIDETGLTTDMMRQRGWSIGGQRVLDTAPGGHWHSNTLVSAINADGVLAAMVLDGPLNAICFEGFCRDFLAPVLRPGQIVVLDNLSSHKSSAAETWIHQAGARFAYLPPYSPDLNPIENVFSKIKQLLRGLRPRTWTEIIAAVRDVLLAISPADCLHAIEHCGYEIC